MSVLSSMRVLSVGRLCKPASTSSARFLHYTAATRSSSPSIWNKTSTTTETSEHASSGNDPKLHDAFKDVSVAPSQADDPWAIPMQHQGTLPEDVPANPGAIDGEHPEGRAVNEPTETMRARLVYLSRKRGILEMEMLLSTFVQDRLKSMTREEMQEYDRVRVYGLLLSCRIATDNLPACSCSFKMLTLPDWTLFYWAIGKKEIPADSEWKHSKVLGRYIVHI
jgi:succinate dehydrogenase assembly factor 2